MVCCHKWRQLVFHHFIIENFSFEDKYEYEIKLKVFARVLQEKRAPQKASFYCFSPKTLGQLFILEKVKPSPASKMMKLLTFTGSCLYYILARTRCSSMTMTTISPAKMMLVHAWTILSIEKILYLKSSSSQNLKLSNSPSTVTGGNKAGVDLVYVTTFPALLCRSMCLLCKSYRSYAN